MTTLATADSKWNHSIEKRSDSVLDPRASVATWATTRYAPSVFTFNANWAPGPLVAVAATSTTLSPGVWNRQNLHTGAAGDDKTLDDVERVSHLDFSDDEGDGEDEQDKWDGQQKGYEHDDYSPGPTPTQAHARYQPIYRPSDPLADSNAAYLASYGFSDGLGYERPPPDLSLRSSSPSNYSIYGGDDSYDDDNKNENAANSKFLNYESIRYPLPPSQPTRTNRAGAYSEPPPPPAPWPSSLKASNALLTSLALDAPLRDDPVGSWEALCWEELEGESDSDSDFGDEEDEDERACLDGRGGKGEMGEGGGRREDEREVRDTWDRKDVGHRDAIVEDADGGDEDGWRDFLSSPPSPSRLPSPPPAPSPYRHLTYDDDQTETDVRTLSNETATTETSTITAENSEEWISLTGARAQAARARILPSRAPLPLPPSAVATSAAISQVQVPFPTHLQADTSLLLTSSARPTRTPVDPVLAATPPLQMAYQQHEHANANNGRVEDESERAEREGGREGETETETAPHYGESGRDRLLTLTERDPPPYDLEYGSEYGSETRRVHEEQHHGGDADEGEERTHIQEADTVLRTSSSSPFQSQPQPQLSSQYPLPAPRTRSQLTFPTSPTDSLPTLTSRTSPTTASPTDTLTLTTPAGTFFSALFPAPRPPEDSIHYAPGRPGSGSGSGSSKGRGGGSRPASPFSVLSSLGGGTFGHSSPEPKPGSGTESGLRQRPRPLPARPRGARTTAGTWLSASAAGPYANGTRAGLGSPSSSQWGSTSDLRFGVYTGFSNGTRNGNADMDTELPLAMRVSTEVVVERDDDDDDDDDDREREGERGAKLGEETRVALAPLRREDFFPSPSPSPIHHLNAKADSSARPVDRDGSGFRKEGDLKSNSQFHITSKVEAVGTQHRSSSSSSRPLQRLATRCGTLSRRIGIVAGVGVVGRER